MYDSWYGPQSDWPAVHLSAIAPVVVVWMDNSAAVHFYLYRNGELIDQFGNRSSVIYQWKNEEEQARYRGKPELWVDFLLNPTDGAKLRAVWQNDGDADTILDTTAALFGWHPLLCSGGYTVDHDGIPEYYRAYIDRLQNIAANPEYGNETFPWAGEPVDLDLFVEFEPDLSG